MYYKGRVVVYTPDLLYKTVKFDSRAIFTSLQEPNLNISPAGILVQERTGKLRPRLKKDKKLMEYK